MSKSNGRLSVCATLAAILVSAAGCSGSPEGFSDSGVIPIELDGSIVSHDTGVQGTGTGTGVGSGSGGTHDAGAPKTDAGHDSGNPSTGHDAGVDSGGIVVDNGDGFGAARTACINEINRLRATQGHAMLSPWSTASIDTCVDEQSTSDEASGQAHQAWLNNTYPTCNGNAQDECEGYGTSPAEIVSCLDDMWAEKDQSNCTGCAACSGTPYTPQNCPNCDYSGMMGGECGHYVNMSADYYAEVACGFATGPAGCGAPDGSCSWAVQNFQ